MDSTWDSPIRKHLPIEQALRRSHCTKRLADGRPLRGEEAHECVGTCVIKPGGVILLCKPCGREDYDTTGATEIEDEQADDALRLAKRMTT